jgi:hypothetical protein
MKLAIVTLGGLVAIMAGGMARADGDSKAAPTTVFSNQDPKGKGPFSGERAGENTAGAGGYNKVVKNPGGGGAPLPRDDQHDMQTTVPRQQKASASDSRATETTYRKSPAVGRGNTADNSRLDPATGKRVLPNTEASSNPGNADAPTAPGAFYIPTRSEDRLRGEQNSGAYADMAVPAGGGTPNDEMQRSRALSVTFDPGVAALTPEIQQSIEGLLTEAKAAGSIDEIKVITWGDTERGNGKLPKGEQKLAAKRGDEIKAFVKGKTTNTSVSTINMAKKPGLLYGLLNHTDKVVRDQLENAGLAAKAGGKASRAIVMVVMKR